MVCGGWGTPDFPLRFVSSRDRIRMFGWMDVRGGGGGGVIIPGRAWHLVLPHDEGKGWDGMVGLNGWIDGWHDNDSDNDNSWWDDGYPTHQVCGVRAGKIIHTV